MLFKFIAQIKITLHANTCGNVINSKQLRTALGETFLNKKVE